MTADGFRRLALRLPETIEKAHHDHPDFRVAGKIFATLGVPDKKWGMVKLTPKQQQEFVKSDPGVFVPVSGGWGRQGATNVLLRLARRNSLEKALAIAWHNNAPKSLTNKIDIRD